jgi:hypothetical protein
MPIRPENRSKYPKDWKEISHRIRFVRAGGRCEWFDVWADERCPAIHGEPHPATGSKVVLTTMHLDHDPTNCDEKNLLAACQLHHNLWDAEHRNQTRIATRLRPIHELTGELFDGQDYEVPRGYEPWE